MRQSTYRALWIFVGLSLVAAVVGVALLIGDGDGDQGDAVLPPISKSRTGSETSLDARAVDMENTGAKIDRTSSEEKIRSRERVTSDRPSISGRVLEKGTGKPIDRFHFRLRRKEVDRKPSTLLFDETIHDEKGHFSISLARGGTYTLSVRSSSHALASFGDLNIPDDVGLRDFQIELDPGLSVSGRVVAAATGKPVENSLVGSNRVTWPVRIKMGHEEYCIHTYTDAEGRFTLQGLTGKEQKIAALHPDFAEGFVDVTPGGDGSEIVIELEPGHFVFGRALNDDGIPLAGLVISLYGGKQRIPIARTAFTAKDGTYRVGPAEPGQHMVAAEPPPEATESSFCFTKERKKALLIDRDVEVNFGPAADQVTWSGKVIDPTGLPVRGIELSASMDVAFAKEHYSTDGANAQCGEDGSFIMRKLFPGRYRLYLDFPGQSGFEWKEIVFENPGPVTHDLELECGAIKGLVVDAETGQAAAAKSCTAQLEMTRLPTKSYSTFDIKSGEFCLRGLKPGTYTVSASGRDIPYSETESVAISSGVIVEGIKVEVPPFGQVEMTFAGFSDEENISYYFRAEGGVYSHGSKSSKASRQRFICLEPGEWEAHFHLYDVGFIVRTIRIGRDDTIEMVINREDFEPSSHVVAVAGTIVYGDGNPVNDASVDFSAGGIPGLTEEQSRLSGKTDGDGSFITEGFRPGRWTVRIEIPEKGHHHLPKIVIPENSSSPFVYTATISRGEVVGRIYPDPTVNDIMAGPRVSLSVNLNNVDSGNRVGPARLSSLEENGGQRFAVRFVPPGLYTLVAGGTGHARYRSPPFSVGEGETIEMPTLYLEPADAVVVKVTGTAGEKLKGVRIKFLDLESSFQGTYLSKSLRFYKNDQLLPGPNKVRISASGYGEKELTLKRSVKGLELVEVYLQKK